MVSGRLCCVEAAFDRTNLVALERRKIYRDPDKLANAAQDLKRLVPGYQKLSGARAIGPHLDPARNRSRSFRVFVDGLQRVVAALPPAGADG